MQPQPTGEERAQLTALREENERLRLRLGEAEQTLEAIRSGEVDSLVVEGPQGPRVYALEGLGNAYRVLLESMSEGAATLSQSGVILYCNGRLASLLELPLQRVMGASFSSFVPEPARASFESFLTRDEAHGESSVQTADGVRIPVYVSTNAIEIEGEKTICLIVVDLRTQKRAEALAAAKLAAEESEARRRLASEVARIGTFEWDVVADAQRWSPELEALYGLAPGTFEGTYEAWAAHVHPDDLPAAEAKIRRALDTGSFQCEFRVVWPDGQVRWLETRATVIRDVVGRPVRLVGASLDVTERREAEEALRRSEARADAERRLLDAVLTAAPAGIEVADAEGRLVRVNAAAERLWGPARPSQSLDAYRAWRGWWADDSERRGRPVEPHEWALARALRGEVVRGEVVEVEPFATPGTRRTILKSAAPVRDGEGRITGAVVTHTDITPLIAAQRAVRESEAHYRAAFEQAAVGFAEVDLEGRWLRTNARLCGIVGYTWEELERLTFQDVTHPDDLAADLALWHEVIAGGRQTYSMDKRYVRKDGSIVWVRISVSLVRGASGAPEYGLAVIADIDAEKRATQQRDAYEKALDEERAFLQRVLASVPVGVALADKATRKLTFANDALVRLFGGLPRSTRGDGVDEVTRETRVVRPDGTPIGPDETPLARALDRAEEVHGEEVSFSHPSGRRLALRVSALPLCDASGEQTGALVVVEDVTHERERARFAEQLVAIVGHDLRNPIGAIIMSATLLGRTVGDNKYVRGILTSAERMTNMVDQLLDLTRSRLGGGIPIERKALALDDVVTRAVDELRLVHPSRDIRCTTPGDVRGDWDGQRLAQVVSNLVGNAVEHGDPRRPVDVRVAACDGDVVLDVHSFGPPIPPDLRPVLFEPYRRGAARGRPSRGLGLGLYITQQIVLAHGGHIDVDSGETGTTFRVTLPRH